MSHNVQFTEFELIVREGVVCVSIRVFWTNIHKEADGLQCHKAHIKEAGLERALPALVESGILQKKRKNMYLVSTWPFQSGTLDLPVLTSTKNSHPERWGPLIT